ncbi:MAG: DUF5665 domain-containing protein [bacterium]
MAKKNKKPEQDKVAVTTKAIEKIAAQLERNGLYDFIELQLKPWRMIWVNFVGGIARGFGMAVGFTVLVGLSIYIIAQVLPHIANVPVIGAWVTDIVMIVQDNLKHAQNTPR